MPTVAFVSFRLGGTDGVSVVAAAWQRCFEHWGWRTITVAGSGPVDVTVPGLAIDDRGPPDRQRLNRALASADLVVAENICTIPLNLAASGAVIDALRGRPALLHHHDPPWQRTRFAHVTALPPDDPAWRHVTINRLTTEQFRERGLAATTIYNGFDLHPAPGDRARTRALLGLSDSQRLVAHPVRAIARKNVPAALTLATALDAVYWLPGPAEEDYQATLDNVLSEARTPVLRVALQPPGLGAGRRGEGISISDLYAACDLVAFPSTWEGFGNPPIEAAIHRRPVAVGPYPIGEELRRLGFWWLDPSDPDAVARGMDHAPDSLLERNRAIVEEHLSLEIMARRVKELIDQAGFWP